jgi:hypothetical protein
MPIMSCTVNGKKGYKWGPSGKCYTGPNARNRAAAQAAAAYSHGFREKNLTAEQIKDMGNAIAEVVVTKITEE